MRGCFITQIHNYGIFLNIDSEKLSYNGKETISFTGSDKEIRLDSVDLSIQSVRISGKETKFSIIPEEQALSVENSAGQDGTLEIEFSGSIPRLLTGLYLAKTMDQNIFTTQFESTGARRMFPCIDHPDYKATFDISVEVDSNLDVISNMPKSNEEINGSRKTVKFQKTPRMSTYLLYLGVGKFDSRSIKRKNTDVIMAAPKGGLTVSDFPLEIASKVLDYFEDYFGIDFALPKVHLISVPEFAAGAMENWGAITFREVYLSIDESTSSFSYKATGEVIAHELAHQWFGNLVTMKWWNDLWLNESFATFMSYKALSEIQPEWDTFGDMVLLRTEGALKNDSLKDTHPIDADVKSPDDIAQIFDEISYGKGASILRMIEGYVGAENFRDGIRKYLQDNKYGNAKGSDLWSSIEHVSGMPVSKVMEAWIKIKGYPVVEVSHGKDSIDLKQEQFLVSGGKTSQIWPIPLTYYQGDSVESMLLDASQGKFPGKGPVKLNANYSGFYRTLYTSEQFEEIVSGMKHLTNLDLWGLANDTYYAMLSGRLNATEYVGRIRQIWASTEPIVIHEIAGELHSLLLMSPESKSIQALAREFSQLHLNRLGEKTKGESINTSVARGALKALLILVDDQYASSQSKKFQDYFEVDPDERSSVALSFALKGGSFSEMYSMFERSKTDEDRTRILSAMGWLKKVEDLEMALDLIRTGKVKKQDTARFYTAASQSPASRKFMFDNMEYAIRQLREVYVASRVPSRTLEAIGPLLGIGRENAMKEKLGQFKTQDMSVSVRKVQELLTVYSRASKNFSSL